MTTLGYGRNQILALYRSCRRSMLRIPDPAQRQMYDTHLKASFRAKRQLFPNSREAILAVDDAREQLDRMNYYHSIREEKERQQRLDLASKHNNDSSSSKVAKSKYDNVGGGVKHEIVRRWLEEALPHLHSDDLGYYTSQLIEDGFDSTEILEADLTKEDLDFMKKAHRRALIRVKGLEDRDT